MAVRLQMKLGFVADADRLADSPDTIRHHEPEVGAVVRSKGQLYLVVTSRVGGSKAREATRLVADTIENEYYYDESAGIRVCIEKAIRSANKRLAASGDRYGLGKATDGNGAIGVAAAVVRGNELYVATVGPAEAYLIRQARLSTLPDPHRERGLPSDGLEPEVWRGEISVGDSLVLASENLVAKLGTDELKDALVTLHPQSAMEHLHHSFVTSSGSGSDGALAIEATEVSSTSKQRTLVAVRPPEPLAGSPDKSPIPLADSAAGGVAAVSASASRAKTAAGGAAGRLVGRLQDLLPSRDTSHRKVTTATSRAETQRRAAVAALALVVIVSALGIGAWVMGGNGSSNPRASITVATTALQQVRDDLAKISGPGIDLIRDDPRQAETLLLDANTKLGEARAAGVASATLDPLRLQVQQGLDAIYSVVPVQSKIGFAFPTTQPADLGAVILGPGGPGSTNGVPYVIDDATKSVYRVDLVTKKATLVIKSGEKANGGTAADPRFLAVGGGDPTKGGRDLLILDSHNTLWKWRPADTKGRGTLTRVGVRGSASWGSDVRGFGTFNRGTTGTAGYNLYIVDPSQQQILTYTPAADGSGYPGNPTGRLATAQPVDDVDFMFIDGDIYFAQGGAVKRVVPAAGWKPGTLPDTTIRPTSHYTWLGSYDDRGTGIIYAYDATNARIVTWDKTPGDDGSGKYEKQYRLANGDPGWGDLRSFYVVPGTASQPPEVVWVDARTVGVASLVAVTETVAGGSTSASPGPSSSASPSGSAKPTARPTAKPKPKPTKKP
ncbi:MAG TPA: hypothetical protein VEG29_07415 [Candidatus Binatia bacterium]|nr:hypothetical protein [Candidatus Binatia bacterium]